MIKESLAEQGLWSLPEQHQQNFSHLEDIPLNQTFENKIRNANPLFPCMQGLGERMLVMVSPLSQMWSLWDTGATSKGQTSLSWYHVLVYCFSQQSSTSHLPWIMDLSPALKAKVSGINVEPTGEQSLLSAIPQHASFHLPQWQMMLLATTRDKPKILEYSDS